MSPGTCRQTNRSVSARTERNHPNPARTGGRLQRLAVGLLRDGPESAGVCMTRTKRRGAFSEVLALPTSGIGAVDCKCVLVHPDESRPSAEGSFTPCQRACSDALPTLRPQHSLCLMYRCFGPMRATIVAPSAISLSDFSFEHSRVTRRSGSGSSATLAHYDVARSRPRTGRPRRNWLRRSM
jgi:hypothetical protein